MKIPPFTAPVLSGIVIELCCVMCSPISDMTR